jgi:hypothetical protein
LRQLVKERCPCQGATRLREQKKQEARILSDAGPLREQSVEGMRYALPSPGWAPPT